MVILKNSPNFQYVHIFTIQTAQHLEFVKPQVRITLPRRALQNYVILLKKKKILSDANSVLKNKLGELITSLEGARSHLVCSKKVHFTSTFSASILQASIFLVFLLSVYQSLIQYHSYFSYTNKDGEGKENDPSSDSHKLHTDFKIDFDGNTIQKSMEN